MATRPSRIPLPTSCTCERWKRPQYHHNQSTSHGAPNLPPKSWEIYIQSRQTARQDRLWQNEEQERLRAFRTARVEYELLGIQFLFENGNDGHGAVDTCLSDDGDVDYPSALFRRGAVEGEGEGGGGVGRAGEWSPRLMDAVYPTRVPVWEKRERKVSPLVPPPPKKSCEEQQESIEAMLERCRGAGKFKKRLAQRELLGVRRREFLSEEISLFERVLVEGKMLEEGFPVHKDRE